MKVYKCNRIALIIATGIFIISSSSEILASGKKNSRLIPDANTISDSQSQKEVRNTASGTQGSNLKKGKNQQVVSRGENFFELASILADFDSKEFAKRSSICKGEIAPEANDADCTNEVRESANDSRVQNLTGDVELLEEEILPEHSKYWSTRTAECMLKESMPTFEALKSAKFNEMAITEFARVRHLFEDLLGYLEDPSHKTLCVSYCEPIKEVYKSIDPFGRLNSPDHAVEAACVLFHKDLNGSNLDVRYAALMEDLVLNSKEQERVNKYLRATKLKDVAKQHKCLKELRSSKILDDFSENLSKFTYLGVRVKNLGKVHQDLADKVKKLNVAHVKDAQFHPEFTADEVWLLDHEMELMPQMIGPKILNGRWLSSDRFKRTKMKFDERYGELAKSNAAVSALNFANWETGDFMLQSIPKMMRYKGKSEDGMMKFQKWTTGADIYHAGLMMRKPSVEKPHLRDPYILHSLDEDDESSGTAIESLSLGESYFTSGYRYNLHNLISKSKYQDIVGKAARKKGMTSEDFLKSKVKEYSLKYFKKSAKEFDPTEDDELEEQDPLFLIRNDEARRYFSVLPKNRLGKALVSHFTNDDEAEGALARIARERTKEKEKREREKSLRKRIEAERAQAIPSQGEDAVAKHEICSEFAFKESIRFLVFMEDNLKKDLGIAPDKKVFNIPEVRDLSFSSLHTGALSRILKNWEKKGFVGKVPPQVGLFAKE